MGVKETPMDEADFAQEPPTEHTEDAIPEESKDIEEPQIPEPKLKRARTKAPPKETAKDKSKKKKETIDLKQRTICPICKCGMSMHALLYTHSCTKEALGKKKVAPVFDETEPEKEETQEETQEITEVPQIPQMSYREILAREQLELRRHKQQRIVNPIRAHYFRDAY